jgi:hypothetical protein
MDATQNATLSETWEIKVPIFRNRLILRQLFFTIGIPFGILIVFLLISLFGSQSRGALYALILIGATLLLGFLIVLLLYGGTYNLSYRLDTSGVHVLQQPEQVNKSKRANNALMIFGMLRGNPTAVGTGMLASGRYDIAIKWDRVSAVKQIPSAKAIIVKENALQKIAIFCTCENYERIARFVQEQTKN